MKSVHPISELRFDRSVDVGHDLLRRRLLVEDERADDDVLVRVPATATAEAAEEHAIVFPNRSDPGITDLITRLVERDVVHHTILKANPLPNAAAAEADRDEEKRAEAPPNSCARVWFLAVTTGWVAPRILRVIGRALSAVDHQSQTSSPYAAPEDEKCEWDEHLADELVDVALVRCVSEGDCRQLVLRNNPPRGLLRKARELRPGCWRRGGMHGLMAALRSTRAA